MICFIKLTLKCQNVSQNLKRTGIVFLFYFNERLEDYGKKTDIST